MRAEGHVCNRRRENGDIEAPQAVIQLERVKGEEYHIGHMHTHIHYRSVIFFYYNVLCFYVHEACSFFFYQNTNTLQFKIIVFYFNIFLNRIYLCDGKAEYLVI